MSVKVGIIMGSDSDLPVMSKAAEILDELQVPYELTIVSAHRTPDRLCEYAKTAEEKGLSVIIAGAGGAAHLPGMTAAMTVLPVIGVPVQTKALGGVDSLYSIVQMPPGIPVATVAINGAQNAGLLAAKILATEDAALRERLKAYSSKLKQTVLNKADKAAKEVFEVEKRIDYMNKEITDYLVKANQISLPVGDRKKLGALFHVVSDIERVGDHAENIAEDVEKLIDMKEDINGMAGEEIRRMQEMTVKILHLSMDMFNLEDDSHLQEILDLENAIDAKERELQDLHVKCLTKGECSAQVGMMFSDLASNLERVADHATNIAFSILEEDPEGDKPPKVELA